MIFILLLLLFLACCVSGTFVVNVTQASYQAEENQNITLEWTFSSRRETSLSSISIVCEMFTEIRISVLFHLHGGVEFRESQDPEFAGRVQWDKDVLTEGRLTLHVSRLRTSDSGFYVCDILVIPDGRNSRRCWLSVTAAAEPTPLTQTVKPHQKIQGIIVLYIGLGISAVALLALMLSHDVSCCLMMSHDVFLHLLMSSKVDPVCTMDVWEREMDTALEGPTLNINCLDL